MPRQSPARLTLAAALALAICVGLRGQRADRPRRHREATAGRASRDRARRAHPERRRRRSVGHRWLDRRPARSREPRAVRLGGRGGSGQRSSTSGQAGSGTQHRSRAAREATTFPVRRARAETAAVQGSPDVAARPVPPDVAARPVRLDVAARPDPAGAAARRGPAGAAARPDRRTPAAVRRRQQPGRRGRADVHRHLHEHPRRLLRGQQLPQPRHARRRSASRRSRSAYTAVRAARHARQRRGFRASTTP